jgi:hypothetical protein
MRIDDFNFDLYIKWRLYLTKTNQNLIRTINSVGNCRSMFCQNLPTYFRGEIRERADNTSPLRVYVHTTFHVKEAV